MKKKNNSNVKGKADPGFELILYKKESDILTEPEIGTQDDILVENICDIYKEKSSEKPKELRQRPPPLKNINKNFCNNNINDGILEKIKEELPDQTSSQIISKKDSNENKIESIELNNLEDINAETPKKQNCINDNLHLLVAQQSTIQAQSDFNEMLMEMKSALQIEPKDYSNNEDDDSEKDNASDSSSRSYDSQIVDGDSITPLSKKKNKSNILNKKLSQSMEFNNDNLQERSKRLPLEEKVNIHNVNLNKSNCCKNLDWQNSDERIDNFMNPNLQFQFVEIDKNNFIDNINEIQKKSSDSTDTTSTEKLDKTGEFSYKDIIANLLEPTMNLGNNNAEKMTFEDFLKESAEQFEKGIDSFKLFDSQDKENVKFEDY